MVEINNPIRYAPGSLHPDALRARANNNTKPMDDSIRTTQDDTKLAVTSVARNIVHQISTYDKSHPILQKLDEDQCIAATVSNDSILQMLAGPGTGKTTALVHRTAWLINNYHLNASKIILMTFTNQAAKELNERINSILLKCGHDQVKVKTGTFHQMCLRYLARYGNLIDIRSDFVILDDSAQKTMIGRLLKREDVIKFANQLGYSKITTGFRDMQMMSINYWAITSVYSKIRSNLMEIEEFAQTPEGEKSRLIIFILREYETLKKQANQLDFDDLLWYGVKLLRHAPSVVEDIEHVLVDEFQDTDKLQYELVKLFSQQRKNITIVGDPDQSIYSFRNATTENFNRMRQDYPEYQRVYLSCNYRSTKDIVDFSQQVIKSSNSRIDNERTLHAKFDKFKTFGINVTKFRHKNEEVNAIADYIQRLTSLEDGYFKYSDFSILMRFRHLIADLEFVLTAKNIPYRVVGTRSFWQRKEVQIIMNFFVAIKSDLQEDAFVSALQTPKFGLGEKKLENIREENHEGCPTLFSKLAAIIDGTLDFKLSKNVRKGLGVFVDLIRDCRKKLQLESQSSKCLEEVFDMICEYTQIEKLVATESQAANVNEEVINRNLALIREKIQNMGSGDQGDEWGTVIHDYDDKPDYLTSFLYSSSLGYADLDEKSQNSKSNEKVTISTMHGSKGLEWPIVFVPFLSFTGIRDSRNEDEERRIFYVSITRAESACYLTYATSSSGKSFSGSFSDPSEDCYVKFLPSKISPKSKLPLITTDSVQKTASFLQRESSVTGSSAKGFQPASTITSSSKLLAAAPRFGMGFTSASTMIDSDQIFKELDEYHNGKNRKPSTKATKTAKSEHKVSKAKPHGRTLNSWVKNK